MVTGCRASRVMRAGAHNPRKTGVGAHNPQDHPPPAVINGAGEVLSPPRFAPEPQKRFRSLADGCCPAWGNPMAWSSAGRPTWSEAFEEGEEPGW